jgi:DNA-binding PadR family transcriptional regulator
MSTRGDLDRVDLLQGRGWIAADEGTSENNRRAKFYRLTPKGRKQLSVETTKWERLARAITGILRAADQEARS